MNDKVMIFCPTYSINGKKQVLDDTIDSINNLEWDGEKIIVISDDNPFGNGDGENVLHQYQKCWQMFKESDADWLLTFEHDMKAEPDALKKLYAMNKDVAYGVYMLRHGMPVLNTFRKTNTPNIGQPIDLFQDDLKNALQYKQIEVSGTGWGCTLIKRKVVEATEIHRSRQGHYSPDIPFSEDCLKLGFEQWANFEVLCGHYDPKRGWLYPQMNTKEGKMNGIKILVLQNVTIDDNGNTVKLVAGEESSISEQKAHELARAGYVRMINPKPAVKVVNKPEASRPKKAVKNGNN